MARSSATTWRRDDVDAGDGGKQHRHVALPAEDAADRRGDVRGRQTGGRHLVEQRLEQMVVVAIDDGHLEAGVGQPLGRRQAREAGADDDDPNLFVPNLLDHVLHDTSPDGENRRRSERFPRLRADCRRARG